LMFIKESPNRHRESGVAGRSRSERFAGRVARRKPQDLTTQDA
jgi:hypothetical protein